MTTFAAIIHDKTLKRIKIYTFLSVTSMKKQLAVILGAAMSLCSVNVTAQDAMTQFIDELMSRMTLEEKLGQLNQQPSDEILTGPVVGSNASRLAAEGKLGSIFNIRDVEKIHALQKVAVEQSRLGIPILFGMDVIHGYQTIFPLPLGMASTWDTDAVREAAHIAAVEASANGVAWTFSPMVDIALDARWGRQAEGAGEDPYLGSQVAAAMVKGYQGDVFNPQGTGTGIMACV